MDPAERNRLFVEQVKLLGGTEKYIGRTEEKKLLSFAVQHDMPTDAARGFLSRQCEKEGYTLESQLLCQLKEFLDALVDRDKRVDARGLDDAAALCGKWCQGRRSEEQCRRLVAELVQENGYPVVREPGPKDEVKGPSKPPDPVAPSDAPPDCLSRVALRPLLIGIIRRPLLLAIVAIVLLMAWGLIGRYFGVPDLFWHENKAVQFLAGLGATLLLAQVCFVAYLLDNNHPSLQGLPRPAPARGLRRRVADFVHGLMCWFVPDPPKDDEEGDWRQLGWFLSVTWLPLVLLLVVPAFVRPTTTPAGEGGVLVLGLSKEWSLVFGIAQRWPLLLGVLAAIGVGRLFVRTFQKLSARARHTPEDVIARLPRRLWLHLGTLLCFAGLFCLCWKGSDIALAFFLGLWLATHGALVFVYSVADVSPEDRWQHFLGGLAFAGTFLVYELLFVVYWVGPTWLADALIPPVLVLWLLLAMVVMAHGFLKFHFRGWYTLVAALLVAVAVLVGSLTTYRHPFPGLDYSADKRVSLADNDFEAISDMPAELEKEKQEKLLRLLYGRLQKRCQIQSGATEEKAAPESKGAEALKKDCKDLQEELAQVETKHLEKWRARLQKKPQDKNPKLAVVVVSGGGKRAALWTAIVLKRLEDRKNGLSNFPEHVRLISGASGGMVAAAYYTAGLRQRKEGVEHEAGEAFLEKVAQDNLTPLAQRLLFVDVPAAFLPRPSASDRGVALEESWSHQMEKVMDTTFAGLAAGEREGWRPSLVFSPMLVEDGRRLLISNLYLGELTQTSGNFVKPPASVSPAPAPGKKLQPADRPRVGPAGAYRYSLSSLELFGLFPEAHKKFKVSTAARMSASFPYLSPAGELPTRPRRRVVDASYYDNYGVNIAAAWIAHHRTWLEKNTSGVVLIQICDSSNDYRFHYPDPEESWELSHGLQWLTGPLVGARSAMDAMMAFRNDEQVAALSAAFPKREPAFFTTVAFDYGDKIPMSWCLRGAEVERMKRSFPGAPAAPADGAGAPALSANEQVLAKLREWWTAK